MYCSECGKEINDGDIFCAFCGTKQEMEKEETVDVKEEVKSPPDNADISLDKETVKKWVVKIVLFVLVYILYNLSQKEMIGLSAYYQLTIPEFVKYVGTFSSPVEDMQFLLGVFNVGIVLYFAASAFAFFDKDSMAAFCVVSAFIVTGFAVLLFYASVMNITQATDFFDAIPMLKLNFWLYIGLNFIILGYSIKNI